MRAAVWMGAVVVPIAHGERGGGNMDKVVDLLSNRTVLSHA
jgi:hypothetical protein